LLEPWKQRKGELNKTMPMPDLEDDDEWEVEEVRDERMLENEPHFLVKWKGWPSEYNQWVSQDNMANAKGNIRKFWKDKARR
jgi:hypothetical protein